MPVSYKLVYENTSIQSHHPNLTIPMSLSHVTTLRPYTVVANVYEDV